MSQGTRSSNRGQRGIPTLNSAAAYLLQSSGSPGGALASFADYVCVAPQLFTSPLKISERARWGVQIGLNGEQHAGLAA